VGSGFSSASVFDRIELPPESREWQALLIPMGILLFFLALVLGTALLTNSVKTVVFTQGSFGYATQVDDQATAQWLRWQRALRLAEPTVGVGLPGGLENVAQVTWRRLVLIYQLPTGDTASSIGLQKAKAVEDALRNLPLWQRLCNEMPSRYQILCKQGDSMVSSTHGSFQEVSTAEVAAGVQADILLDGLGSEVLIELETLLQIYEERSPSTLRRWLPKDYTGPQGKAAFRSSFAFALNPSADNVWRSLVIDEVEPTLVNLGVMSAARDQQDQFRVYLEADDVFELAPRDLQRSMDEDLPLLVFGPLSAFLATLASRGRIFVAMVAAVLALCVPLVTSIGFLSQQQEDGHEEVRIIAAAAWFVISAGMADLCSACTHALEERKESLRPQVPEWLMVRMLVTESVMPWMLEEAKGKKALALRVLRVCCEALLPTVALGLTLLLTAAPGQLDMVAVFAQHTGLGLLVAVPLAVLLIPPAIEAGDALANQILHWRNETEWDTSEALLTLFDNLLPLEFGAKQDWQNEFKFKMRKRMRDFLRLRWLSLAVLLVILGLLMVYLVFSIIGDTVYTAETPRLFEVGHRLYDKANIRQLFDPLEGYQAPMATLQLARRCSPTASDSAACTWFKCEAGPTAELQDTVPSECKCYTLQANQPGCAGTAARLFGDQARNILASGLFWSWAGARLNQVFNTTGSEDFIESLLEIEVWSSGGRSLNPGARTKTAQAASWEAACQRILCFCGGMECSSLESYTELGTFDFGFLDPSFLNSSSSNASTNTSGTTESQGEVANITFAWGIQVSSEPLSETETGISFSRSLVLEDVDAQRQLLSFCQGTAPELEILERSCWPIEFKEWLQQRGAYYPVASETFYGSLRQFFQEKAASDQSVISTSGEDMLSGFWMTGQGTATALFFTFQVVPPQGDAGEDSTTEGLWQNYQALRNRYTPTSLGAAWLAPSSAVVAAGQRATAAVMQQNARTVAIMSVLIPALILLLVTCSWGLTLASVFLMVLSMMVLEFHHTRVNQLEVGVLEIVCLLAYNSFIILGLFRVSIQVAWSQDGPGRDPHRKHRKHVQAQKIGRLSVLEGLCQESEEPDGSKFLLRSLSKSNSLATVKKSVEDLNFEDKKVLLRHMAVLNSPAIFEGGLRHERLGRSARATCRAGTEAVTSLLCLAISSTSVLLTSLEGISQVRCAWCALQVVQ